MDEHSLELLEYPRVIAALAAYASCEGAHAALLAWRPIADRASRDRECERLDQAIRRSGEPGAWCFCGTVPLAPLLERAATAALDGAALGDVRGWLDAAHATRQAWQDETLVARFPALAALAEDLRPPEALRDRLAKALDPDGRLRDAASPALGRLRRESVEGERRLEQRLARWAQGFGSGAYVTRHADRFVALVPAAGFPRRRAIVHDVSGSGQSLFVEPIEFCEENNRALELRAAVLDEERRILLELTGEVRAAALPLEALETVLVHLDTLRARARWAREHEAIAVKPAGERLRLAGARHPLLAMAAQASTGEAVVPLDLELASAPLGPGRLLLVSGPNMGGKTVLLKTVGLSIALAHAALPVPARPESTIPAITGMLVDLGDEQSVERGLSTFAAHLKVLTRMAAQASADTLLLCDEVGAGTDPEEGAALGRALIEHFAACRAWGVVTTHLGSLKRLAGEVSGVVNGSLEFDLETLTPRYRFVAGVPGASHAIAVAERLGFPAPLLERARALTPESARALERLAGELAEATRAARREHETLERARREAEVAAEEHRRTIEETRRELSERRARLTRESETLLARARELWQAVQREARRGEKSRADAGRLRQQMTELEQELDAFGASAGGTAPGAAALPVESVTPGQRVRVLDLGVEADVVTRPDAEGKVQLRRGSWSIQSHVSRLAAAATRPASEARVNGTWTAAEEAAPLEVDLRGMEVDEALSALDQGLDRAVLAGLGELRIVHGIGRGVLRAAVEKHLRGHPQVAGQRMGVVGEGGRGATVVRLR